MTGRALVLGSGGNAAIAWEIGAITGMDLWIVICFIALAYSGTAAQKNADDPRILEIRVYTLKPGTR